MGHGTRRLSFPNEPVQGSLLLTGLTQSIEFTAETLLAFGEH